MVEGSLTTQVRELSTRASVIDLKGDVTAASEQALGDAYTEASGPFTRTIVLNFGGLEYMNSGGIGMLVTLLVRANRQRQRLLAFGLNEHYRQIFELTRLDEAIRIDDTERGSRAMTGAPNDPIQPTEAKPAEAPASRDAAFWAKDVSTLRVGEVPAEAVNLNVTGRRVVGPVQGFGKMWQKTFRVSLRDAEVTPAEVIQTWKTNFQRFWPERNWFYGPITGIAPGEVALLNLALPGRMTLSTGVLVLY